MGDRDRVHPAVTIALAVALIVFLSLAFAFAGLSTPRNSVQPVNAVLRNPADLPPEGGGSCASTSYCRCKLVHTEEECYGWCGACPGGYGTTCRTCTPS